MAGLTWNRANAFADGLAEQTGAGITALGFELLDEMGQLGMALDLSHLSPRGCELALERYGGPVLASHANAAAVFANPRNLADDVLAGVGERGGVVGLCAIPAFVGPGDPTQRLAEHHRHIAAVAGADAVAFGADFCGFFGDGIDPPLLPEQPSRRGHDAGASGGAAAGDVLRRRAVGDRPAGRRGAGMGQRRPVPGRRAGVSVAELIESYRRRERSPVEVARDALDRIERLQPRVNAFVTVTGELALEQAAAAERAYADGTAGPLAGVPITIKDLLDVTGVPHDRRLAPDRAARGGGRRAVRGGGAGGRGRDPGQDGDARGRVEGRDHEPRARLHREPLAGRRLGRRIQRRRGGRGGADAGRPAPGR